MQARPLFDAQRRARNLSALLDMGFECVEGPVQTEAERVAGQWRVSESVPAMGTVVSVTALAAGRDAAEEAIGRAFATMEAAVGLLSRHESSAALAVLNRDGRLSGAPPELVGLLRAAARLHGASGGAFDATVAPVVDVLRAHRDAGHAGLPAPALLTDAIGRVDAAGVRLRGDRIRLDDGVRVTLDGIAKGRVVDLMAAALEQSGVRSYLINAGGDIRTAGTRDGTSPWRVAVRDPATDGTLGQPLRMSRGAVATSGSYEIFFDRERTHHHIIARGGVSPTACHSVTVVAPTAVQADALATAAFVAGPEAGLRLVLGMPEVACLLVTSGGEVRCSPNWRRLVDPSRAEQTP